MVMRKVGCSIPFNYLAGEEGMEFEAVFGSVDECLRLFAGVGVESVELRSVTSAVSADALQRALDRIRGNGLSATIHGTLQKTDPDTGGMEPLMALPEEIGHIVTIHAHAGDGLDPAACAEETVSDLRAMLRATPRNVAFAIELNRKRPPRVDPGSSFHGVLEMVAALDDPRVGICWDFGHTLANVRNGFSEMFPPTEFLKKVIHTHIHDISDEGRTHFPLTCGHLPLEECVDLLERNGYQGVYNFEPGIDRWSFSPEEKRSKMLKSLEMLSLKSIR